MKLTPLKTISLFMALFPTFLFSQNSKSQAIWTFDLQFDFGKSDIRPIHYPRLDSLANAVSKDSSLFIDLNAYTDAIGSDKSNQELSIKRAQSVLYYLTGRGAKSEVFTYDGHGKNSPIADNSTEEGRQQNRRVSVVLKKRVYLATLSGRITDRKGNPLNGAKVIMWSKNQRDSVMSDEYGRYAIDVPYRQYIKIAVSADNCPLFAVDKAFPIANYAENKDVTLACTIPPALADAQVSSKTPERKPIPMRLSGTVTNDSGQILSHTLIVFNLGGKKDSVKTNQKGEYSTRIIKDEKTNLNIAVAGHFPFSETVMKSDSTDNTANFKLKTLKFNTNVSLRNMSFYLGTTELLPESEPELTNLLQFMEMNAKTLVELRGHITSYKWMGRNPVNSEGHILSINRAKAIYEFLVEKGISKDRLVYNGYANWELIYDDPQTFEQDAANRRVEIRILSKDEFKKLKKEETTTR
jgi:outer membrane protein OmpA-like peptidoglycan-associated protein